MNSAQKNKVNILLVDDRPANLIALAAILDRPEYHLVFAHSGEEALEVLREREFAVILLDVQMPEMDGFECARKARAIPGSKGTPIIFVTALYRETRFVQDAYAMGGVDYLFKPLDTEIVRSKVATFVELYAKNKILRTQQDRMARLVAVQRITTDVLANSTAVDQAVPGVLKEVCKALAWDVGTFWDAEPGQNLLRCKYFWSDPSCPASFISGSVNETFAPGVGLPGRVWLAKRALWSREGLGSAVAFPILVGEKFYGVIEFFCREPQVEDLDLLKISTAVGNQIGQFILRVEALRITQEALRCRDEFISIASHELKAPLTVLRCQAHLNRRRFEKNDPAMTTRETFGKFLESNVIQVERMINLVENMLDITRITHGQLAIVREAVDLGDVVAQVAEGFRDQAESNGSRLILDLGTGVVGNWDRFRLEQIMTNLITNAIKYGGDGKIIEVSVRADAGSALISVKDYGRGIAAESLERIFHRFERAVGRENTNGLGLGLYISLQIAKAHDGDLRVVSELGKGSTFTVELPFEVTQDCALRG